MSGLIREIEPIWKNEASMGTKKDKLIKTVLRCILHGSMGPICG